MYIRFSLTILDMQQIYVSNLSCYIQYIYICAVYIYSWVSHKNANLFPQTRDEQLKRKFYSTLEHVIQLEQQQQQQPVQQLKMKHTIYATNKNVKKIKIN